MKILLAPLLLAVSLPAFAEVDPKIHKLCIEAKDYAGCVKAQGGIRGSNSASSGVAEAKTKEISDKIYDFNRRQFIAQNPSLSGWIKSNPKAARQKIEKEFLFFKKKDYQDMEGLYSVCRRRGAMSIDYNFNWSRPCSEVSNKQSVKYNNQLLYNSIKKEQKRQVAVSIAKAKCTSQGKQIRYSLNDESMCMSDFEYASYREQRRARRADEAYRARIIRQGETEVQNGFTYRNSSVSQLKIRGSYGRYLSFWGRSKNEYQGTTGSYNPGSAGSVNCTSTSYGYGSTSTNCSRSGYVAPSYTPGTSGGIQARWFEYELDCRDRTYNRKGDKAKGLINKGWMDVYYDPTARAVADKYCPIINSLRKKV